MVRPRRPSCRLWSLLPVAPSPPGFIRFATRLIRQFPIPQFLHMRIALFGQNPRSRTVQQNLLPARQRQHCPVAPRRHDNNRRRAAWSER